jgi:prepilin-type N-terminal cleavage/methylation domain-containing protein
MKKITKQQPGFTFVELLFAIVVLGTMFSIAMVVVINTLHFYVFSNSVRQNQENARNILDAIDRDVRFGKLIEPSDTSDTIGRVCVLKSAENRVILYENLSQNITKKVFSYITEPSNCSDPALVLQGNAMTLNVDRMKVPAFDVTKTQGAPVEAKPNAAAVLIKMQVLTGTANADNKCDTADIYCNSIILNTAVNIRGGD